MKKREFTKEEDKLIIDKYLEQNYSITKLAKELNTSNTTLSKHIKQDLGIEVINKLNLLNYFIEDIIPLYKLGISLTKIALQFNTTRDTLSRMLKKNGYKVVNHQNLTKFDETIFDSLENEESAYWFGFILADGNISNSNYQFEISLTATDIEHLLKFNLFSKHNKDNVKVGNVYCNGKVFLRCRWSVTNKHLWNVLNSHGCVPNKSKILEFPTIMENSNCIRHFIRGYFDGDGCISYRKTNTEIKPVISMLGTFKFLSKIKEIRLS